MKKQFTAFIVAIVLSIIGSSLVAQVGHQFNDGKLKYEVIASNGVEVMGLVTPFPVPPQSGLHNPNDLYIPERALDKNSGHSYTVVSIGGGAFQNSNVEYLNMSDARGIREIKDYAFTDSEYLGGMLLPDHIERIGGKAFAGCSKLGYILFPFGQSIPINEIEQEAFMYCRSLSEIVTFKMTPGGPVRPTVPPVLSTLRVKGIMPTAFVGTGFESLALPDIEYIGHSAFEDCRLLKEVIWPVRNIGTEYKSKLGAIGNRAFALCPNLKYILIPETFSFDNLGVGVFDGCTSLKDVVSFHKPDASNTSDRLGNNNFDNSSTLTSYPNDATVWIPNGTTSDYTSFDISVYTGNPYKEFGKLEVSGIPDVEFGTTSLSSADLSNITINLSSTYPMLPLAVSEPSQFSTAAYPRSIFSGVEHNTKAQLEAFLKKYAKIELSSSNVGNNQSVTLTLPTLDELVAKDAPEAYPINTHALIFYDFVGNINVTKKKVTLIANSVSAAYDGYDKRTEMKGAITASGLVGTDGLDDLTGTLNFGAAHSVTKPGTYNITLTGNLTSDKYDVSYSSNNAKLTITGNYTRYVDIKVKDKSKVYNGTGLTYSQSDLEITGTDFEMGDNPNNFTFTGLSFTGNSSSSAGSYQVSAKATKVTSHSGAIYTYRYQPGNLTISKAPIIVTADNKSKKYDNKPYTGGYTVTVSGLIGSDTQATVLNTPTFSGTAITATAEGTYSIIPSATVKNSNYYISRHVNGELSIVFSSTDSEFVWEGTTDTNFFIPSNWKGNNGPIGSNVWGTEFKSINEKPGVNIIISPNAKNNLVIPEKNGNKNVPKYLYILFNNLTNYSTTAIVVIPAGCRLVVKGDIIGSETLDKAHRIRILEGTGGKPNGTFYFTKPQTVYATVTMHLIGEKLHGVDPTTIVDTDPDSPTTGTNISSAYKWQFFGIPVESLDSKDYSGCYLREYSEPYNGKLKDGTVTWYAKWKNVGIDTRMEAFKGYEIAAATGYGNRPRTVGGKINSGMRELKLTASASKTNTKAGVTAPEKIYYGIGQNIYGNSYTASIDIERFFEYNLKTNPKTKDRLEETVYIYSTGSFADWLNNVNNDNGRVERGHNPVSGQYLAIPYKALTNLPLGTLQARIPSMQGFLLKYMIDPNKPVHPDPKMRKKLYPDLTLKVDVNNYNGYAFTKTGDKFNNLDIQMAKAEKEEKSYLQVGLSSKTTIDNLWFIKNSKTTDRFDNGWDGRKSFGTTKAFIYSETEDGNMQINATNSLENKLITIRSNKDTEYKLKVVKGDLDNYYPNLSILDLETKTLIPLDKDTTVYRFTADKNQTKKRFKIVNRRNFTTNDKLDITETLSVKYHRGTLTLTNQTEYDGKLIVVDLSGRLVYVDKVDKNSYEREKLLDLSKGVYILKLKAGKESTKPLKVVVE